MSESPTSDANASLFFSPPEIPLIFPGIPIMTSPHLFKPICNTTHNHIETVLENKWHSPYICHNDNDTDNDDDDDDNDDINDNNILQWIELISFYPRQHTDARYWYSKYVRLSVRP